MYNMIWSWAKCILLYFSKSTSSREYPSILSMALFSNFGLDLWLKVLRSHEDTEIEITRY